MGCTPKQMAKSMYLAIEFAEKQSHLVSEARLVRTAPQTPQRIYRNGAHRFSAGHERCI